MITLSVVAKHAGVSIATVSRVINNDKLHPVSNKTAERVLASVVELGYKPNEHARRLRKKQQMFPENFPLGVLLTSSGDSYSDPFFYDILLAIQSQAAQRGFSLGFTYAFGNNPFDNLQNELQFSEIAGVILLGRMNQETLLFAKEKFNHVVYAGLNHIDQHFDEVICDGYLCAKVAVHHLASIGRKKIGFIGNAIHAHSKQIFNEYRYDGYLDSLKELSLPFYPEYQVDTPLNIEAAHQATSRLLKSGNIPDALFCANDYCALGALRALHTLKIKVPQDVAIASIDNIEMSAYSQPMLTTVHVPRQELGRYAVDTLIDQILTKRKFPIRLTLPHNLIVRESSDLSYHCLP